MLNKEQIELNKAKFLETNAKYNLFNQELLDFLGEEFFLAPSSMSLLNVCFKAAKYAVKTNDILPDNMKQTPSSILKCVFLSQIGKSFLFKPNPSEWHRKNLGKMYEFTDSEVSMKSNERSIHYVLRFGIQLSEEEFQTILNSDRDTEDKLVKYRASNLSNVVRIGFELAILEEKNAKKSN
jgi:hypothetical protein